MNIQHQKPYSLVVDDRFSLYTLRSVINRISNVTALIAPTLIYMYIYVAIQHTTYSQVYIIPYSTTHTNIYLLIIHQPHMKRRRRRRRGGGKTII